MSSASNGVSISIVPIFESSGQPAPGGEELVSAAYCSGEQDPKPAASDGFAVIPSGSVTTASLRLDVESVIGFSHDCGTSVETASPVGDSAVWALGTTVMPGSNGTRSQPVIGPVSVVASDHASGCSHESARILDVNIPQLVGF